MSNKKVKAQMQIFKELETQLMVQAERLGVRDNYSGLKMKELECDALNKHLIAFYQEKANLEYEMQMMGTDKKEVLIKLERLEVYIKRGERLAKSYEAETRKILEKLYPDQKQVEKATRHRGISVTIGVN